MTDSINDIQQLSYLLKHTREQKGLALSKMAEILKVPSKKLEDVENGYFHQFHEAFLKGLIRSYAKHLNIVHQSDEIFSKIWPHAPKGNDQLSTQTNIPREKSHLLAYFLGSLGFAIVAYAVFWCWMWYQQNNPSTIAHDKVITSSQSENLVPTSTPTSATQADMPNIQAVASTSATGTVVQNMTDVTASQKQASSSNAVASIVQNTQALTPASSALVASASSTPAATPNVASVSDATPIEQNFSLSLSEPAWVEVRRFNKKIIHSGMTQGQLYLKIDEPVIVKIGNSTAIQKLEFNGMVVDAKKYSSGAVTRMVLGKA